MTTPKRFDTEEEYQQAVQRLEDIRRNPSGNPQEQRDLTESIEAYKAANPNAGQSQSQGSQGTQKGSQGQGTQGSKGSTR